MPPSQEAGASTVRKLFIQPLIEPDAAPPPATTPVVNTSPQKTTDAKPKLQELSTGNLEAARRKQTALIRVAASANGRTLFAILNIGYVPIHLQLPEREQVREREHGSTAVQQRREACTRQAYSDADAPLSEAMEYLVLYFQEKIAWAIFNHPSLLYRPKIRNRIRDLLIERYSRDAFRVADSYYKRKIPEYTLADAWDLRMAAVHGVIQCIDQYSLSVGCKTFMHFANAKRGSRVRGAIYDCLRKLQDYPRSVAKRRRDIGPMMLSLMHKIGREPNTDDFCSEYGEEWRAIVEDPLFGSRVYNQMRCSTDGDTGLDHMSNVQDSIENHEDEWSNEDAAKFRSRIMSLLPDPQQAFVIHAYFWLGWNIEHIAEHAMMQCSTSQASKVRSDALFRIKAFADGQDGRPTAQELFNLLPNKT